VDSAVRGFPVIRLVVEQVGDAAELLGSALQSFNLLAQADQFGLLLVQHLMDVSHGKALLMAI
jgi:hypothetical protein